MQGSLAEGFVCQKHYVDPYFQSFNSGSKFIIRSRLATYSKQTWNQPKGIYIIIKTMSSLDSFITQCSIAIKQSQTVRGRRIDSSSLTMHGEPSPTTSAHPEVASYVGLPHQSPNPCRAHFLWCKAPQTRPLPFCDHACHHVRQPAGETPFQGQWGDQSRLGSIRYSASSSHNKYEVSTFKHLITNTTTVGP